MQTNASSIAPPKLLGFLAMTTTGTAIRRPVITCSVWCGHCRQFHGFGSDWADLPDPFSAELTFPSPCGTGMVAVGVDPGRRADSVQALRLHHDAMRRWRAGRAAIVCRPMGEPEPATPKPRKPRRARKVAGSRPAPPEAMVITGEPVALLHGRLSAWRSGGLPVVELRCRCPVCREVHRIPWPEGTPPDRAIVVRSACSIGPWSGSIVSVAVDPDRIAEARKVMDEHRAKLRSFGVEQELARGFSPGPMQGPLLPDAMIPQA
jgi:hypothetical protein